MQSSKAASPIVANEDGSRMLTSDVHSENVSSLIIVTDDWLRSIDVME